MTEAGKNPDPNESIPSWLWEEAVQVVEDARLGVLGETIEDFDESAALSEGEVNIDDFPKAVNYYLARKPEYQEYIQKLIEARDEAARALVRVWDLLGDIEEARDDLGEPIAQILYQAHELRRGAKSLDT